MKLQPLKDEYIIVFENVDELSRIAAKKIVRRAQEAVENKGIFTIALSGGSTPKKLFALLAEEPFRSQMPWTATHFFFGDERHVAPDNEESNFRMANETMFSKINELPKENIHRVLAEKEATHAARDYEANLHEFFDSDENEFPRFDLILLGMGADGHTASLFPGSKALAENSRYFVENWIEKFAAFRLTLTFPVINNARSILFLIGGAEKSTVLSEILSNNAAEAPYPVQRIKPTKGELLWLLDEGAAGQISLS
jgi:6-phosphogluconolactonase